MLRSIKERWLDSVTQLFTLGLVVGRYGFCAIFILTSSRRGRTRHAFSWIDIVMLRSLRQASPGVILSGLVARL